MSAALRILLGYIPVLAVSGWLILSAAFDVIKPGMRQSAEETLVDTANLLAALVAEDVREGTIAESDLAARIEAYTEAEFNADIWGVAKTGPNHRIYVTDRDGRVIFDSAGRDLGADYSRWNDVWLTLRGNYGARTTAESGDEDETVMYVAAPIRDGDAIIGVLSVGKPNLSMVPFLERAEQRIWAGAALALVGALVLAGLASWWHTRPIRTLVRYVRGVAAGERVEPPQVHDAELAELATALADMRAELDGKAYIEHYVQALTHEINSPLASILSAGELLHETLPSADRDRLLDNIEDDAARIQRLVERLLTLARIEQRHGLETVAAVDLRERLASLIEQRTTLAAATEILITNSVPVATMVEADPSLLDSAIANLLDNALDFTPPGGRIECRAGREADATVLSIHNDGAAIPDYALPRLTERFYSLPRPNGGRKSTGLGLSFVREAAELHGGSFLIANSNAGGVTAELRLPVHQSGA